MEKRIYSLDLLKFILACYLMVGHFQQDTGTLFKYINIFDNPLLEFHEVELFFLISGFLAYKSLGKISKIGFGDYIVPKIIRLWPMVFLSVTVGEFALILWYLLTGNLFASFGFWNLLNSYLLTFQGGAVNNIGLGVNNPTWYICVLLICYSLLYFLVFVSNRTNTSYIWYMVIMIFIGIGIRQYGINLPFLNTIVARGYNAFFLGIILNRVYYLIKDKKYVGIIAFIIVGLIIYCIFRHPMFIDDRWGVDCFILHPALLILFLRISKYMKSDKWKILGGLSFEIYIWHAVLIVYYNCFMYMHPNIELNGEMRMLIFGSITILFSLFMYMFIENKINYKINNVVRRIKG